MSCSTSRSASCALAGIHLVRAAVAELRRRRGRVAERTVERRTVLGRVRHDRDVLEPALVERLADRADAAVHHVRRRDDVGAGGGVRDGRAHELLDRRIVGDLVVDDDAAVAVVGVLAEADVGDDQHVRRRALDRADRRLHRRLRIVGAEPMSSFWSGRPKSSTLADAVGLAAVASRTASSTDRLKTPGIDDTSRRTPSPSQTNSGRMNMSGDRRVSRTSARIVSDVRSRRRRRVSFSVDFAV